MAILKTEAVVLDRLDYSNTSLIVTFYTQLFGRLSIIAFIIIIMKSCLFATNNFA